MENSVALSEGSIAERIFYLRGRKVMFDFDLAGLYGVETRAPKQQVRRNRDRFPEDFMFELTTEEVRMMVSQIVIPSKSYFGGSSPMAFTEQGIAMLSSVLRSKRAIAINIEIMRAFVNLRRAIGSNAELSRKLEDMEKKYDRQFGVVFEAIRQLIRQKNEQVEKIGFKIPKKDENNQD